MPYQSTWNTFSPMRLMESILSEGISKRVLCSNGTFKTQQDTGFSTERVLYVIVSVIATQRDIRIYHLEHQKLLSPDGNWLISEK